MAYSSIAQTIGAAKPEPDLVALAQTFPAGSVLTAADQTAVAAAIATAVADGATPTQAHVTAINTAWTTALTNSTAQGDAVLLFNPATVLTVSKLKRILDACLQAAKSGLGGLTP